MMLDEQQVQALLRLKRFEQPPPGYFDRTLEEFHRRQRAELLKQSAFRIWYDRFVSGLWSFKVPPYIYGTAFGLFAVVATLIGTGAFGPQSAEVTSSIVQAANPQKQTLFALVEQHGLQDHATPVMLKLAPTLQPSSISQPRYILDGRPLAQQTSFNF
jgi:hypothetical protein